MISMIREKDSKVFRASNRQGSAITTTVAQSHESEDIAWRHFPQFEKFLEAEHSPLMLKRIEKTCKQLDEFIQSGSTQEKSRAQAAMAAYGRTLELWRQLSELRDKIAKPK